MALNIKPFEGPRAPDWTDPSSEGATAPTKKECSDQQSLEDSDTHLLYLSKPTAEDSRAVSLKKLDIV